MSQSGRQLLYGSIFTGSDPQSVPEPLGPLPRAVAPRGLRDARDRARSGTLAGRRPYLPLSRRSGPARRARIHRLAHSRPQSGISLIPPHPSDGHRIISHIALDSELWGVATMSVWSYRSVNAGHECPRHLARKRPGLPTSWTRVLERNPEAMRPEPLPGYVWLDAPGKVLHVEADRLEFRDDPP
jgi:hypothetical protein